MKISEKIRKLLNFRKANRKESQYRDSRKFRNTSEYLERLSSFPKNAVSFVVDTSGNERTFALIVSAHPHCALSSHVTSCIEPAR